MKRKYIGTYATWSDLFGSRYETARLVEFIQELPWGGVLNVIPQMMNFNSAELQSDFIQFLQTRGTPVPLINGILEKLKKRVIVSDQGLLSTCKWLLAYGSRDKFDIYLEPEAARGLAVYLCLIVSDFLYDPSHSNRPEYELLQNLAFNTRDNLRAALARGYHVYVELAQERTRYEPKEFVDINGDFQRQHGISFAEYLSIVSGVILHLITKERKIDYDWLIDADLLFSATHQASTAKAVLWDSLVLSLEDAQAWARDTLGNPWDFTLLQARPLIEVDQRRFFPIANFMLDDQMFLGAFHKLRQCYSATDTNYLRFVGRPFEEYIKELTVNAAEHSSLPYVVYPEFSYGKGGMKRSPDVMLRLGDRLLAIEAKAQRMRHDGVIHGDSGVIDGDLARLVTGPLNQAYGKVSELTRLEHPALLGVQEVHLMSVSMGGFPTFTPFESKISSLLHLDPELPVSGIYHVDIEEFELLCGLIESKRPIFRYLANKNRLGPRMSLKNFLVDQKLPRRFPQTVTVQRDRFFEEIVGTLFPGEKL